MTIVELTNPAATVTGPAPLERRGRRWIFGSFAFCPCPLARSSRGTYGSQDMTFGPAPGRGRQSRSQDNR